MVRTHLELEKEINRLIQEWKDISLSDGSPPRFIFEGKVVYEADGKIMRLSSYSNTKIRLGFLYWAKEQGVDFFLPEKIEQRSEMFVLTSQEKISPFVKTTVQTSSDLLARLENNVFSRILKQRILDDYSEKEVRAIDKVLETVNCLGMHQRNVGIDAQGKVRAFDYVVDVAYTSQYLITCSQNLCSVKELPLP